MGPAHSTIVNHTTSRLCIITFPHSDHIYYTYSGLYVVEPGQSGVVESTPDALGLKIGLVYDINPKTHELFYARFVSKNDAVLNISEVSNDDISWYGDDIEGYNLGVLKERDKVPLQMALQALRNGAAELNAPTVFEKVARTETASVPPTIDTLKQGAIISNSSQTSTTPTRNSILPNMPSVKVIPPKPLPVSDSSVIGPELSQLKASSLTQLPAVATNSAPFKSVVDISAQEKWEFQLNKMKTLSADAVAKLAQSKADQNLIARHAREQVQARIEIENAQAQMNESLQYTADHKLRLNGLDKKRDSGSKFGRNTHVADSPTSSITNTNDIGSDNEDEKEEYDVNRNGKKKATTHVVDKLSTGKKQNTKKSAVTTLKSVAEENDQESENSSEFHQKIKGGKKKASRNATTVKKPTSRRSKYDDDDDVEVDDEDVEERSDESGDELRNEDDDEEEDDDEDTDKKKKLSTKKVVRNKKARRRSSVGVVSQGCTCSIM